jgi:DNA-binding NtrC family response regulator
MIAIHYLDDDELQREKVRLQLSQTSTQVFTVHLTSSIDEMIETFDKAMICLIDLHLSPAGLAEGLNVIKTLCTKRHSQLIIAYSNDLKSIQAAMAAGADDFIHKSTTGDLLALRLQASYQLRNPTAINLIQRNPSFVGQTMTNVARRVPDILKSALRCVHVRGETGTGKEVVADCFAKYLLPKTISRVNCGAISPQLLESELFGHVKGAFTGAVHDKIGYLEQASGSWIFLDELATLSTHAQVSLLRVIENQELMRVGDRQIRKVNIKVLSASNEPIQALVDQGRFRNDLWQRLRETVIDLPPLSERKEEIEELIEYFCRVEEGGPYQMSPEGMEILKNLKWRSGNIRSLRNCIRAMTERHVNFQLTPFGIPDWAKEEPKKATGEHGLVLRLPDGAVTFESITDHGLIALIKWYRAKDPRISQRELATQLGLPKSTLVSKLKKIVERGLLSPSELTNILQ